ncbi:MAG: Polyribonucleotide nucleotidyltransferase [candidate division WS2 bacterium ADurb.Bin280]|uniref:Polyribonucleotide nucleotidyltransferase n=1 Tax=candidate division WS2 bacterium ADurb.Bin280 TaxID=1852829 RepID=A0A1V5SEH8_9BACT|nr:MAG: Polyribonucleotide nucleotidyltransferase [candidate division WS2 bacterium ADurb.Bin280]
MEKKEIEFSVAGQNLRLSSGELAMQADGAILAQAGGTMVLATCVVGKEPSDMDYMPLSIDYEERFYASGKISGSRFIKREGRPSEQAILNSRMIDRPIRPLFPKYFRHETQVIITTLSFDKENDPDMLALLAASTAICQSMAPFMGPIGGVRVGMIDGEFVANPLRSQMENSTLDLVVVGTKKRVLMLEASSKEISEEKVVEAIEFAQTYIDQLIDAQEPFINPDKIAVEDHTVEMQLAVKELIGSRLHQTMLDRENAAKEDNVQSLKDEILTAFEGKYKQADLEEVFNKFLEKEVRETILADGIRPDGRKLDEIRPLDIKTGLLPRAHGSGLFTRGQTQSLTIATLASPGMEQFIDTMEEDTTKRYMHFYNFPPYSTGEVKRVGSASRREIGHGALAEKALVPVLPSKDEFPYTIRLVSEILSSNGSSSMAATCGSTLALMDAGVPIKEPVAGIAMGMVSRPKTGEKVEIEGIEEDEKYQFAVLTDLQGVEDFGGDMDFKVAGTKNGITAIQLDVKIDGLSMEMIRSTLTKAKVGRDFIMQKMLSIIPSSKIELSQYAPRIITVKINPAKIGELIGPGGKNIQNIIAQAGGKEVVAVDIEDDGTVMISSADSKAAELVKSMVEGQTVEPELDKIYDGEVVNIQKDRNTGKEIGAIVKFLPNKDGMVHISEICDERIPDVSCKVKVGDKVKVKVTGIDPEKGRVSLSIKKAK